jgi:precorrin-3B methylase
MKNKGTIRNSKSHLVKPRNGVGMALVGSGPRGAYLFSALVREIRKRERRGVIVPGFSIWYTCTAARPFVGSRVLRDAENWARRGSSKVSSGFHGGEQAA